MFEYSFETAEGTKSVTWDGPMFKQAKEAILIRAVTDGLVDTAELRAKLDEAFA